MLRTSPVDLSGGGGYGGNSLMIGISSDRNPNGEGIPVRFEVGLCTLNKPVWWSSGMILA